MALFPSQIVLGVSAHALMPVEAQHHAHTESTQATHIHAQTHAHKSHTLIQ